MKRIALLAGLVLGMAAPVVAQSPERCRIQFSTSGSGGFVSSAAGETRWASGGVRLGCVGQRVTVTTDSAIVYPGGDVDFVGRVRYSDTTVTIAATRATFRRATETWEARGDVAIRNLETGSTVRGPAVDYLRAAAGVRDSAEVYATGRPRVDYFDTDSVASAGDTREPYKIVADRLRSRGKSLVWAGGRVTVDRSDLSAHGDSMRLDTGTRDDGSLLGGKPEFRGLGADSFLVRGARIDFTLEDRAVSGVLAQVDAHVERKDWTLDADTIALAVHDRAVQQINAWGTQATGASSRYALRGDSVVIETPAQQLRKLQSFGDGWVAGAVDSATGERSWLAGDTVLALFQAADSADTAATRLARLEAHAGARSYQQVAPAKPGEKAGLSYVRASDIVIFMKPEGSEEVQRVEARGAVQGVQLDPADGG
ncbi:MAG TPA: hypothetical protein VFI41_09710 [Gemmatimonadales bacterium]|jgi:hypothetical protein|nr:hypothetical protein [Gemmatimonadales bacterium]